MKSTFDPQNDLTELSGKVIIVTGGKYVQVIHIFPSLHLELFISQVEGRALQRSNISREPVLRYTWPLEMRGKPYRPSKSSIMKAFNQEMERSNG